MGGGGGVFFSHLVAMPPTLNRWGATREWGAQGTTTQCLATKDHEELDHCGCPYFRHTSDTAFIMSRYER